MVLDNRCDKDLAFMLRYENVAWYEDGKVRILDRRVYPKEEFVYCSSHIEVAKAIKDMVTQSAGPFTAAPMGLALAAFECKDKSKDEQIEYLKNAAISLYSARPTTKMRMKILVEEALKNAFLAIEEGRDACDAIVSSVIDMNNQRYYEIDRIAKHLTKKIENGSKVLTYCFAETILGMLGRNLKEQGKEVSFYCCETRPYFQGSRLTASCLFDMGFDVTVITLSLIHI